MIDLYLNEKGITVSLDIEPGEYEDAKRIFNLNKRLCIYENDLWIIKNRCVGEYLRWCEYHRYPVHMNRGVQEYIDSLRPKKDSIVFHDTFQDEILKQKLFRYQREKVETGINISRLYNASDAGTGKSKMTVAILAHWFFKKRIDGIFLIVPNGLQYQWKHEILEFTSVFYEDDIQIVYNENKKGIFSVYDDRKILIVPAHLVNDIFRHYQKDDRKIIDRPLVNVRSRWNKKSIALVIDEAHIFKNEATVKFQALWSHINYFQHRIFLSATPAINFFLDWFSQLNLLDPGILQMSSMEARYFVAREMGTDRDEFAVTDYDESKVMFIKERMQDNVLKVSKKELRDMPDSEFKTGEPIIQPIYFEFNHIQKKLYAEMCEDILLKIPAGENLSLRQIEMKFPYFKQFLENPRLLDYKIENGELTFQSSLSDYIFAEDPRIVYLDGFLKYRIEDLKQKVIIYDQHPLTLDMLERKYFKYSPLKRHGAMKSSPEERYAVQEKFNERDSEHKLFLVGYQAGSTGLNLQKGSNIIVLFCQPGDSLLYKQAIERVDRITSEIDAEIYVLLFDRTYNIHQWNINRGRVELNDNFWNKSLTEIQLRLLFDGTLKLRPS